MGPQDTVKRCRDVCQSELKQPAGRLACRGSSQWTLLWALPCVPFRCTIKCGNHVFNKDLLEHSLNKGMGGASGVRGWTSTAPRRVAPGKERWVGCVWEQAMPLKSPCPALWDPTGLQAVASWVLTSCGLLSSSGQARLTNPATGPLAIVQGQARFCSQHPCRGAHG